MSDRFRPFTAVHVILLKKDAVLLMKRINTGYMDEHWGLPSGHVEENESLTAAAIREAVEETGVKIKPEDLQFATVDYRTDIRISTDFFFIAQEWTGKPTNKEKDKCTEIKWFKLNDLPAEIIPYISLGLKNTFQGNQYAEIGWE